MDLTNPKIFFSIEEFEHKKIFDNISNVWDVLTKLSSYLKEVSNNNILSKIPSDTYLENPESIFIDKNCIIEPGAFIKGPCIIGEGSTVRQGAYIRGNVLTGKNCVIGHATEIKNSILLNKAAAPHFNYVGDSILGNNTNLGAGVICSNLRLDKKEIYVIIAGRIYHTGMKKFGLILADGSQIGCNSVSNPGTLIGKDSFCHPCVNVSGWIPERSIIKGQHFSVEARK